MTRPPNGPSDASVVSQWLAARSRALDADPDVAPPQLPDAVLVADIVGVAMGLRTGHESLLAAHALVRALVGAGFRAIALEGTTTTGERLNRWVKTGHGDPRALLAGGHPVLRNSETLAFLQWLRAHNLSNPTDPVELVHPVGPDTWAGLDDIETQMATTDLSWRERTGRRVVHLGGIAHLVAGGARTVEPAGTVG
ncbi:MAG: erythromycin esterase family protein, partial [Mycobacterium sp.]